MRSAQGYFQAAARLAGATEALIAATHPTFEHIDSVHYERSMEAMHHALGEEGVEQSAWLCNTTLLLESVDFKAVAS